MEIQIKEKIEYLNILFNVALSQSKLEKSFQSAFQRKSLELLHLINRPIGRLIDILRFKHA
jgi:hypothetical protein